MNKNVRYDMDGNPICEECGKAFSMLLSHVRHSHKEMTGAEYKAKHNLHPKKPITSLAYKQNKRDAIYKNYDKHIEQLAKVRKKGAFKKGNKMQSIRHEIKDIPLTTTEMIKKLEKQKK